MTRGIKYVILYERVAGKAWNNRREDYFPLTTIQNENSPTECRVVSLDVFNLYENNFVELPTVFSTGKLPVDESSIPRQADVDRWSHLKDVTINKIDAPIGILIGNDAPRALEPKNLRNAKERVHMQ